ncbi:hypothetical protein D9615_006012 [Tricholomella constricta]|uniref:Uncharacterized protein n=1 Tax=Tricholomella constricta TaxID=117010 RepID=A0A8H5H9B4_9AGAR|nr:hypothetical protein D9615_006012 [Tricholomella constricta]
METGMLTKRLRSPIIHSTCSGSRSALATLAPSPTHDPSTRHTAYAKPLDILSLFFDASPGFAQSTPDRFISITSDDIAF